MWLKRVLSYSNDEQEANHYFSIGHGDYDEESESEPDYIIWTYLGGRIVKGPLNTGTHGSLWGHGVTDNVYKGRYEPTTGRLSIVKPWDRQKEPVDMVVRALNRTFDHITEIVEF